jgi:hypothetical protein
MTGDVLAEATKDDLVLAMLAVMGGEGRGVNERDLFLACWHAFPNAMRWVDTPLPNPDTFTASLRRLDQRGYIARLGKQKRQGKRSRPRRKTMLDAPGKAGVVKARIVDGGLAAADVGPDLVEAVGQLRPDHQSGLVSDATAITICVGLRERGGRGVDEGVLVELAFHRFPDRFAYVERPEFPDLERVRNAIRAARNEGLLDSGLALTKVGWTAIADRAKEGKARLEASQAPPVGELRFAARIEASDGYLAFTENGTLLKTKPDELYRALRVPPMADPRPVADALRARVRGLRRIDKGELASYLLEVAARHNPEAFELVQAEQKPPASAITRGRG